MRFRIVHGWKKKKPRTRYLDFDTNQNGFSLVQWILSWLMKLSVPILKIVVTTQCLAFGGSWTKYSIQQQFQTIRYRFSSLISSFDLLTMSLSSNCMLCCIQWAPNMNGWDFKTFFFFFILSIKMIVIWFASAWEKRTTGNFTHTIQAITENIEMNLKSSLPAVIFSDTFEIKINGTKFVIVYNNKNYFHVKQTEKKREMEKESVTSAAHPINMN